MTREELTPGNGTRPSGLDVLTRSNGDHTPNETECMIGFFYSETPSCIFLKITPIVTDNKTYPYE